MEVAVEDGRAYLAASDALFDVIMVDAYQDITCLLYTSRCV